MNILQESSGKISFTRVMGALCVATLLGVFIFAAFKGNWETVRALATDVALLAGGLYGFNRLGSAYENKGVTDGKVA